MVIRRATDDDLVDLFELEKAASTAALGHVFGPDIPFPDDDVLSRWRLVLDDCDMSVLIDEDGGTVVGYAAFTDGWLRHFALAPDWWGTGRAKTLHHAAMAGLAARGASTTYLWVLVENRRARSFYERHGWVDAGIRDHEVFAPYPVKMQMTRS